MDWAHLSDMEGGAEKLKLKYQVRTLSLQWRKSEIASSGDQAEGEIKLKDWKKKWLDKEAEEVEVRKLPEEMLFILLGARVRA